MNRTHCLRIARAARSPRAATLLAGLVLVGLLLAGSVAQAAVVRVPGDFVDVRNAIAAAASGDTVQIAGNGGSTYRSSNLLIDKDLTLQGGWRVDFAVRDPDLYVSVLLDTSATFSAPALRITGSPQVVIDGVQIIGGLAGISARDGADLVIRNCVIRDQRNTAVGDPELNIGTGLRAFGGTVLVENTTFRSIVSSYPGAALGLVDVSTARLVDTRVRNCISSRISGDASGGGIYARDVGDLRLEQCSFSGTATVQRGGGGYLLRTPVVVTDGDFSDGLASTVAGMFYLDQCPTAVFSRCTFENSRGTRAGAILALDVGMLTLEEIQFSGNRATVESGALHLERSAFAITDCTFTRNNSEQVPVVVADRGGAVFSVQSNGTVTNTSFADEKAIGQGGAWSQVGGDVEFLNCRFERCRAGVFGGGLQIELGGRIGLTECLILGCEARFGGGVAASFTGDIDLNHCTVVGGRGLSAGAAIYVDTDSAVGLRNSIACCAVSGDVAFCGSGTILVDHSNVWNDDSVNLRGEYGGECADPTGTNGNLRQDPQLCTADPDYGLQAGSPSAGAAADGSDQGWRPVGCAASTPLNVTDTSWGRIKSLYRTR